MREIPEGLKENAGVYYHGDYCLYSGVRRIDDNNIYTSAYDNGAIRSVSFNLVSMEIYYKPNYAAVTVEFEDGSIAKWDTKWISVYNTLPGIAVSKDGRYVFVQTWENGLHCLDARTGEKVWRTKSKRGITSIFVSESTVLCHQRERALQLLDIHTGEVLKEKRPATGWDFAAIDHRHIVCQVTARRWEIIDVATLEAKRSCTHKEFTNGHEDYCVRDILLDGSELVVRGFKNVWDESVSPAKPLPNLEFEHRFTIDLDDNEE